MSSDDVIPCNSKVPSPTDLHEALFMDTFVHYPVKSAHFLKLDVSKRPLSNTIP